MTLCVPQLNCIDCFTHNNKSNINAWKRNMRLNLAQRKNKKFYI